MSYEVHIRLYSFDSVVPGTEAYLEPSRTSETAFYENS